jgi:hypothetical protein
VSSFIRSDDILSPGSGRLASPATQPQGQILSHKERIGHKEKISFDFFAIFKSFLRMRNFSDGPWLSKTGIYSRQDAKNAKSGNLISLRSLREIFRVLVAALPR